MRTRFILAGFCALALAAPAMAQTTASPSANAPSGSSAAAPSQMPPGTMQKDVKSDLEKAGFTDVQVMPSSFLVRAKDKQGRPVMMVINPDSVTEITNMGKPASTTHK